MKKQFAFIASLLLLASLFAGCKTSLQSGGAYAPGSFQIGTNADGTLATNFLASASPDLAFYYADASYNTAYAIVDGALKWEMQNEAALWKLNPKIKHTLDAIRPKAWDIHVRWAKARQAYLANPIPANLTIYQQIVAEIQNIATAATAAESLSLVTPKTATPTH